MGDDPGCVVTDAHIANEWADAATSGLQWLRNIRDGISTVHDALENMEGECKRIAALRDAPGRQKRDCKLKRTLSDDVAMVRAVLRAGVTDEDRRDAMEAFDRIVVVELSAIRDAALEQALVLTRLHVRIPSGQLDLQGFERSIHALKSQPAKET